MIAEWDRHFPGRSLNVFGALSRVVPTHLMDKELFDFSSLQATGMPDVMGDKAFDEEDFDTPAAHTLADTDDAPGASPSGPKVVSRIDLGTLP